MVVDNLCLNCLFPYGTKPFYDNIQTGLNSEKSAVCLDLVNYNYQGYFLHKIKMHVRDTFPCADVTHIFNVRANVKSLLEGWALAWQLRHQLGCPRPMSKYLSSIPGSGSWLWLPAGADPRR